jgi:hypothetical protein
LRSEGTKGAKSTRKLLRRLANAIEYAPVLSLAVKTPFEHGSGLQNPR